MQVNTTKEAKVLDLSTRIAHSEGAKAFAEKTMNAKLDKIEQLMTPHKLVKPTTTSQRHSPTALRVSGILPTAPLKRHAPTLLPVSGILPPGLAYCQSLMP
jgi:hypothetical protein